MDGPILVTGGCGLVGANIVDALLKQGLGPITVVSRNPTVNLFDKVNYVAGDIADSAFVQRIFGEIKPTIVFHTASPRVADETVKDSAWNDTNVLGTRHLLASAQASETRAFIYTSTINVIRGEEHINAKEDDYTYWKADDSAIPYWRSKARAEQDVLAANSDTFKVVAIRPCFIMGIREHSLIPTQLDALKEGKTKIQLGNNKNLWDVVSVDNCAEAHLLAMRALFDPVKVGRVAGQAFNITDDNPLPFWDVQRVIWKAAGDKTEAKDVTVIPTWVAGGMARVTELAYKILFFGTKNPVLNRQMVHFCTRNYYYNIDKAKDVLGYQPVPHTKDVLREATAWEMARRSTAGAASKTSVTKETSSSKSPNLGIKETTNQAPA